MRPSSALADKILPLDALLERLAPLRAGGGIVFTNGCFDLLHPGHVDLLHRARELGRVLVVGLNSDASVTGLKGPSRPVTPFADRALVLAGLASVDFVTGFDAPTPRELIEAVLPHVLVKGGDWPVESIVGRDAVERAGGRVLSLPLLPGYSTTETLRRALSLAEPARERSGS
ncbi:Bifunctional protein HldE [Fundidesulfovibrio magnetotacticus]|uniref:Bifunctional protein HldE n=1 Tax=Fundidesulfovibrio magnetotacticus TaxID=2730080 RepID=A0A6V8LLE1_9BACT|nr:adenylyltransferase/cytidyltransferase family protein [Fundidesulfovibrio magnetotacticus]GFK92514.1 Bifunctional protein HldE [Fundidesulfovibrio magnetotacticus]